MAWTGQQRSPTPSTTILGTRPGFPALPPYLAPATSKLAFLTGVDRWHQALNKSTNTYSIRFPAWEGVQLVAGGSAFHAAPAPVECLRSLTGQARHSNHGTLAAQLPKQHDSSPAHPRLACQRSKSCRFTEITGYSSR